MQVSAKSQICVFYVTFLKNVSLYSCEQPCAHAEHYNLTHTPVPATHTDARKHGLAPFSLAPLPLC